MMQSGTVVVQDRKTEAWRDRLLIAGIGFGAVVTVAWCGFIAGGVLWLAQWMMF